MEICWDSDGGHSSLQGWKLLACRNGNTSWQMDKTDRDTPGGGFKDFVFSSLFGKIPILTNIFQMGWNHQLVMKDKGHLHTTAAKALHLAYWNLTSGIRKTVQYIGD